MKTIETQITITDHRTVTVQLPEAVEPGEYCVTIVLEEIARTKVDVKQPAVVPHDCATRPEDL